MKRVLLVGGGPSGLRCAFNLLQQGHEVSLFEGEPKLGGMARSFDFRGARIEQYYHFICSSDTTLVRTINQLGLGAQLRWRYTRMGTWWQNRLYPSGSVGEMLRFPPLKFAERLRFLWGSLRASQRASWEGLENIPAVPWLRHQFGLAAYEVLWEPLMRHKFGAYAHRVSAAWIWTRIKRLAQSRTPILKRERLGYLVGGSELVLGRLADRIRGMGGRIHLSASVERILLHGDCVRGLYVGGSEITGDAVVSTVALPQLIRLLPDGLGTYQEHLRQTRSVGVVCGLFRTTTSLSPYFWINIGGNGSSCPGIIEYTNLNPRPEIGGSIIYIPNYLPREHEHFTIEDHVLIGIFSRTLSRTFPHFRPSDVTDSLVFRDLYAQPICEVGFTRAMVAQRSPVAGLFVTESSQLHPHDRNISQTFDLADQVSSLVEAYIRPSHPQETEK